MESGEQCDGMRFRALMAAAPSSADDAVGLPHVVLRCVAGDETRDFPNLFEGLADDAKDFGIAVEELSERTSPDYLASPDYLTLILANAWVIFLLQPWYAEDIVPWLRKHAGTLRRRMFAPGREDAPRLRIVSSGGVDSLGYELSLGMMAKLRDGRLAKLLVREDCEEDELAEALITFSVAVSRDWRGIENANGGAPPSRMESPRHYQRFLLVTYDHASQRLVPIKDGFGRNRIEPKV